VNVNKVREQGTGNREQGTGGEGDRRRRGKREEGRGKREEGRGKREEGRGKRGRSPVHGHKESSFPRTRESRVAEPVSAHSTLDSRVRGNDDSLDECSYEVPAALS
jgi:hypothetical protein